MTEHTNPNDPADDDGHRAPPQPPREAPPRSSPPPGASPGHLGDDLRHFERGRAGTLAEQRSLIDAEGDDIREYTGEPVETDDGWVIPQQQNVGPGNMAGGGEWPDPGAPPAQPDEPRPDERRPDERRPGDTPRDDEATPRGG